MFREKGAIFKLVFLGLAVISLSLLLNFRLAKADTFVWQDFEYWTAPQNFGWKSSCPPYPVYGWCPYTGFGRISTIIDMELQSRVFQYECMMSPLNQFYNFYAWNQSVVYHTGEPINDKPIISFNIRMFLGVEWFDMWEVHITVMSREGEQVNLIYRPIGESESGPKPFEGRPGDIFIGMLDPPGYIYELGRQYQDGTWHLIVRDLDRDVDLVDDGERNFSDGYAGHPVTDDPGESKILSILLKGYQLRVDNISFHDSLSDIINYPPKLQRIGPQYAQLFAPYSLMITATDIDPFTGGLSEERLEFLVTINGYGSQGIQTSNMIYRVKDDPNNPGTDIICDFNDAACIPNKVLLQFIPQVFEDLIITIRVVDEGGLSDTETFPLSVVNYPVVNHPPYLEEIEDDVYILGSNDGFFEKEFVCYDQDEEDDPGSAANDLEGNITYTAWIDLRASYQYGPWQEPLIPNPFIPEIYFSPKFEGIHRIQVVATDTRGMSAITEFSLIVVNQGTWLNHPPILCEDIDSPQIAKAGRMFVIPVEFYDPDGDRIFYSCNVGSVTEIKEGFGTTLESKIGQTVGEDVFGRYVSGAIYTFNSQWPGTYFIQIIAYDIRGGYAIMEFLLDVQPWWTY